MAGDPQVEEDAVDFGGPDVGEQSLHIREVTPDDYQAIRVNSRCQSAGTFGASLSVPVDADHATADLQCIEQRGRMAAPAQCPVDVGSGAIRNETVYDSFAKNRCVVAGGVVFGVPRFTRRLLVGLVAGHSRPMTRSASVS